MTTDAPIKTGYWRVNPATGEREWIEGNYQPRKPKEWKGFEPGTPEAIEAAKAYKPPEGITEEAPAVEPIKPIEPLEPIEPEVPAVDVTELAEAYGLRTSQFVSERQLADLALPPEERTTVYMIPYEQYLTWEQARWLGYDVPEGSLVKMTPMAEGEPSFSIVPRPQVVAPPRIDIELEETLRTFYPEMFDPARSYGYSLEEIPNAVVQGIQGWMQTDYQGFVDDLFSKVGKERGADILRQLDVKEEFVLLALDHKEQEARILQDVQAVFPDFDNLEDFDRFIQEDQELFRESIQFGDALPDDKRRLLEAMGIPPEQIDALIGEPLTTTELAQENLELSWDKYVTGEFSWGEFGQVALGVLGVAGSYIEKYAGRPWETAILEARSRFQKATGFGTEMDDATLRRLEETRNKYGWAGALVAEDVSDIWHDYVEQSDIAKPALQIVEWLNPAYLIPIGGTFGLAARFTSKIPLLGRVMKATASGVQAIERGITYPVAKPLEIGVRYGARGAQAVGEGIGKSLADRLIKQSKHLFTLEDIAKLNSDDIINGLLVDNWQRKVLQTVAKIPPARVGIEKALGWRILLKTESMAMHDIVGRAGVLHSHFQKMGIDCKALKYWELQDISRKPVKLFGFDKNGYSAKLGGNLEEIFTRPSAFKLNPEQTAYVTKFNEVNTEILNLLKKEGVPPENVIDDWVHRVVLTEGQKRGVSRRIGAKPSYEKVRKFETMADGIKYFMEHPELKAHYANNPELLMSDYIQGAFKKIADERFVKYIAKELEATGKTFGVKPTEKLIQFPELFEEITGKAGRELAEKAVLRTEELSAARQFKGVMNRALRGETPHPSTLAMLERKFPELGKRFREAIGNKDALQAIKTEVKALAEARKVPFWEAKTERAFRMSQLRQPTLKEGYIMEPFAGGKLYDREFIDAFNKFFGHEAGLPGLNITSDVAGILRITKAALDLSFQAIQGLPSWGLAHAYMLKDPVVGARLLGEWYKTLGQSTAAFFRPEVLAKAIAKEKDIAMQLVQFGGSARSIDYFQVLSARKGLAGAFEKVSQKIPLTPYQRAETAFFGGGQLVRNRFAKILMPKALKQGKEFELARFLDRITGLTDSASLGVPMTVRQLEQTFGWFAPNYTRACLTVLADVFRGGMTGALTREALGGMIAAGSAMYSGVQFAIASLEGKSEEEAWRTVQEGFGVVTDPITGEVTWKPTGRFMTIKVGNYNMGFGGFWYGLLRLAGNIMACVDEVGDKEPIDLVRIMKHGTLNKQDNPFIYWWFTRASPLFGAGYELATGKDFLGYPIETSAEYAQYIATRFEPIWMEQGLNWMIPGVARDNEIPEGLARQAIIPAEVFGLRTFPEGQWVKFYDKANDLIKHIPQEELDPKQVDAWKEGTLTWRQLTDIQRINLLSRYPDLEEQYNKAQSDSAVRGSENWKAWQGRVDEERTTYYSRGDSLVERLVTGDLDSREFREMWSEAGQNYGVSLDMLEKEPAYAEIYGYFNDKEAKGEKYGFMDNVALQEYINIVFADYLDEKGDIDWDAKDRAVDEFIDKFGEDTYDRIRQFYADKKRLEGLHPTLIRMADDKDSLGRDYWQLPYKPISEMDEEDEEDGYIPAEHLALWKQFQALETDEQKDAFIEAHPEIGKDWRAEWRLNNPEDDARLALWGYGGKLQSMEAYDLIAKWGKELGIPLEQMGLGLPPRTIAPLYFEHNKIVKDTSPSSVQSKLYKLTTGRKLLDWNLEQGIWTDDLSDESIEALTLRDKWKDLIAERDSWKNKSSDAYIPEDEMIMVEGKEVNKRQWTYDKQMADNPEFRDDMRKLDVYQLSKSNPDAFGELMPEDIIAEYLPYAEKVDEFGAASAEAKLYRYDSEHLNQFGLKPNTFAAEGWSELDESRVPIWRIDVKYRTEDAEYDALETPQDRQEYLLKHEDYRKERRRREGYIKGIPEAEIENYVGYYELPTRGYWRERFLVEHPKLAEALGVDIPTKVLPQEYDILSEKEDKSPEDKLRITAYERGVPESHIDNYVGYHSLKKPAEQDLWYENDWFLMENTKFYQEVYISLLGNKPKDFTKVPTRAVFKKYLKYDALPHQFAKKEYRLNNPDLDAWGVIAFGWTPIEEQKRREELTPYERFIEKWALRGEEIEERLKELRGE